VVDPDDYPMVLDALKGGLTPGASPGLRQALATKVFAYTTAYDAAILGYLSRSQESLPPTLSLVLQRQQALRYGENPHQRAALYVTDEPPPGIRDMRQLHGKELSFNNLLVVGLPIVHDEPTLDYKRVRGGFLVQDRFRYSAIADESQWRVATTRRPTDAQWNDLRFAWAAVGAIKSNAIVLVKDEAAIGIGAGQMSRVDSSFLAGHKARQQGHEPQGAVLASDAFFPFRDGVDEAAAA